MNATELQVKDAATRVLAARERILAQRSTAAIMDVLARTARNWLDDASPWRQRAIAEAPDKTGFSPAMVNEAISLTFAEITPAAMTDMLETELGNQQALDDFCPRGRVRARAVGPRLITHILAGNVPAAGIYSIGCGLLLKSANLVKTASRDPVFPALFVESLREVDAELAECVAVLEWPREEAPITAAALAQADAVIAQGDNRTIAALRSMTPPEAKFLGYGHRLSFGIIAKEAMTVDDLTALATAAAFDASVYDQQGCLSAHLYYVEERGALRPRAFAEALAQAMAEYAERVPRGQLSPAEAVAFQNLRHGYEFRSASDQRIAVWTGAQTADWVVAYDDNPSFSPSCLNRFVFVRPTDNFQRVLDNIRRIGAKISTVGVAPLNDRTTALAGELAQMGVHRVCPIGQMQRPPLTWFHDGRPNLADLVRWSELG